jgi:outer membrane protein assembly factor BamB
MKNHMNGCVLIAGSLYGFDMSTLKCLDWATGQVKWEQGTLGKGSLSACNGKLVILSEKGELVIADATPAAFKEISRSQILSGKCWTSPAIADGRIYCRNAKGDLVCLVVK